MLSWVGPGNMYYVGCRRSNGNGNFCSVWPSEKHCKAHDFGGHKISHFRYILPRQFLGSVGPTEETKPNQTQQMQKNTGMKWQLNLKKT